MEWHAMLDLRLHPRSGDRPRCLAEIPLIPARPKDLAGASGSEDEKLHGESHGTEMVDGVSVEYTTIAYC